MLAEYKSELVCDLAETYGLYDYHTIPVSLLITFTEGLGPNSRVGMKLSGTKAPLDTILLARIFDDFQELLYSFSEDAKTGRNRPKHFTDLLIKKSEDKEVATFKTGEDFLKAREAAIKKILKKKKG